MSTPADDAQILANMYAPFFGSLGCTAAMALAAAGAAYGTAKSGTGIAGMSVAAPHLVMRGLIPVIMAGIVAIYGLVVAVILGGNLTSSADKSYTVYKGFGQLASGLVCGMCGIGAGYAIGVAGEAGVRAVAQEQKFFVGMVLILIFAEVLGLYGMIVALVLSGK